MSKKRFIICISIWVFVLLISMTEFGELAGYIFVTIMVFGIQALAAIGALVGIDYKTATAGAVPYYFFMAVIGLFVLFASNNFRRAWLSYSSDDLDLSRKYGAKGLQILAIPSAIALCILSIGH